MKKNNDEIVLSNYIDKLDNVKEKYKDNKFSMYKKKKYLKYTYNIGVLYYRLKQLENAFEYFEEVAYLNYPRGQKALGYFYKTEKDFLYNVKGITYDNSSELSSTWNYLSQGIKNID